MGTFTSIRALFLSGGGNICSFQNVYGTLVMCFVMEKRHHIPGLRHVQLVRRHFWKPRLAEAEHFVYKNSLEISRTLPMCHMNLLASQKTNDRGCKEYQPSGTENQLQPGADIHYLPLFSWGHRGDIQDVAQIIISVLSSQDEFTAWKIKDWDKEQLQKHWKQIWVHWVFPGGMSPLPFGRGQVSDAAVGINRARATGRRDPWSVTSARLLYSECLSS
ncbi:hypothetical protein C8J56DRAFT_896016 [Mycena floridula]|nr:hypothetical protein C8J56DRAFT_896016 [Mycena floridula]